MIDFIVGAIIAALVAMAVAYIVKAKKRGAKCIGCSMACSCSQQSKCMGCSGHTDAL